MPVDARSLWTTDRLQGGELLTVRLMSAPDFAIPLARRRGRPTVRDGRLIAGVLMLLVSIIVGARVVQAAADTTRFLAVSADLPAGHVLVAGDLTLRSAHVEGPGATYLAAGEQSAAVGRMLTRGVAAGELLTATAVASATGPDKALVPVTVDAGRAPALDSGDLVDVWATFAQLEQDKLCVTVPVASGLEVAGQLETTGTGRSIVLRVPSADTAAVVHAAATTTVVLTRHSGPALEQSAPVTQVNGLTPSGTCGAQR